MFGKLNLSPELDSGRLRLNDVIGVAMFTHADDKRRIVYKSVFLFETCMLIVASRNRQIFDKFEVVEKISIYNLKCAKRETLQNKIRQR
jgi:hypothetical protein